MKALSAALLTLALAVALALPVYADVISPGEALVRDIQRNLPIVLLLVLLAVTAILVRRFTKKK